MSMPPNMMQQMLMQRLQQSPQLQGRTNPLQAGSQLMQKIMLLKALQNAPQTPGGATGGQQRQANNMLPQTNAMMTQGMPQVNSQLQEGVNQSMMANPQIQALQQPQIVDPSLMPIAGYS